MLWSALKIIIFLAVVTVLGLVATAVMEAETPVRVEISGYAISVQPFFVVIGVVLLVPSIWILFTLFGFLRAVFNFLIGDETALSRYINRRTERQGFEALADSMVALASGQAKLALGRAEQAERYLDRPELTGVLVAQAAEATGERKRAAAAYRELARNQRTKLAGLTGLLRHKLEDGDTETALKIAQKMFLLNSGNVEVQDTLIKLQSSAGDWEGARGTLAAKRKSRTLPKDVVERRNAVLLFAEGRKKIARGDIDEGQAEIISANRVAPGLVPAAALAAQIKSESGDKKAATRIIKRAWKMSPHPDLAAAFAHLEPDETPAQRLERFLKMIGDGIKDDESRMLLAELRIADGDFAGARQELGDLADRAPEVRTLVILAAIERGEGSREEIVRGWLTKAVSAPRGARWVCDVCNRSDTEWFPVCPGCEALDTLSWKPVPASGSVHSSSVGMMPLLASHSD